MSDDEATLHLIKSIKDGTLTEKEGIKAINDITQKLRKGVSYKASEKGAISFYNLGVPTRFPTTLYKDQLAELVEIVQTDEFAKFLEKNKEKLIDSKDRPSKK